MRLVLVKTWPTTKRQRCSSLSSLFLLFLRASGFLFFTLFFKTSQQSSLPFTPSALYPYTIFIPGYIDTFSRG